MKQFAFQSMICLLLFVFGVNCTNESLEVKLPAEVSFREPAVFINGEAILFKPFFSLDTIWNTMNYGFIEKREDDIINVAGFSFLPVRTGTFDLGTDRNLIDNYARAGFHQIIDEDILGYSYKLKNAEDGFFNVEYLDTIKQEVKGRFRAEFCRTSKNGNKGLGLPKTILIEGVFYEPYKRD